MALNVASCRAPLFRSVRMIEISKREQFYQQEYSGCVYSLRDTNLYRKSQGRPLIKLGKLYYGKDNEEA